jgi:hypothetical protein
MSWRPLAYIPDQDLHYSKQQRGKIPAAVKQARLFKLFHAAIQSFVAAQQPGAMDDIYLPLGDKAKDVMLVIPLAFIIGDNQGGDAISGRIIYYGLSAKRISRSCDATPANYATMAKDSCNYLEMQDIKDLFEDQDWNGLDALYQAQCWNPFFDVDYGANKGGIFLAACPPEALHALEQGVFKHMLESVLGGYLKPVQMTLLDRVVQTWCSLPRQRLFRSSNFPDAPRLRFKDGISSLKQTPGCDRAGMVFALMICSLTRDGEAAFAYLDDELTTKITYCLELLLCYWAWLKQDEYWSLASTDQYERVKDAISILLNELVTLVPRETGNGWNIPKIHEQLHIAFFILMFGAHRNIHSGPAEHNHIELSKQPAVRTQMRAHVFDWQVANRLVDKLVVNLADFTMQEHLSTPPAIVCVPNAFPTSTAVFDLSFWKDSDTLLHVDISNPKSHGKFMPPQSVLILLSNYCFGCDKPNIRCYTELIINDVYLRTNPADKDGPWFDNIIAEDEATTDGHPANRVGQLKFMFCFPDQPGEFFGVLHPAYPYQPKISVVTKMFRMEYEDDVPNILTEVNRVNGEWVLDKDINLNISCPRLIILPLSLVRSHILMIPYHPASKFMIGVLGQSLWAELFVAY